MPQLVFSEEQRREIKDLIYDILLKEYTPRFTETFINIERNLEQKCENIEATQKIVIENQKGIKDLIKLNYDLILRNNNAIKNNYDEIKKNYNGIKENYDLIKEINEKLEKIIQKVS